MAIFMKLILEKEQFKKCLEVAKVGFNVYLKSNLCFYQFYSYFDDIANLSACIEISDALDANFL